jgi:hypothetical protein
MRVSNSVKVYLMEWWMVRSNSDIVCYLFVVSMFVFWAGRPCIPVDVNFSEEYNASIFRSNALSASPRCVSAQLHRSQNLRPHTLTLVVFYVSFNVCDRHVVSYDMISERWVGNGAVLILVRSECRVPYDPAFHFLPKVSHFWRFSMVFSSSHM